MTGVKFENADPSDRENLKNVLFYNYDMWKTDPIDSGKRIALIILLYR